MMSLSQSDCTSERICELKRMVCSPFNERMSSRICLIWFGSKPRSVHRVLRHRGYESMPALDPLAADSPLINCQQADRSSIQATVDPGLAPQRPKPRWRERHAVWRHSGQLDDFHIEMNRRLIREVADLLLSRNRACDISKPPIVTEP